MQIQNRKPNMIGFPETSFIIYPIYKNCDFLDKYPDKLILFRLWH